MGWIEKRGSLLHVEHGPKPLHVQRWADDNRINLGLATVAQDIVSVVPFVLEHAAWLDRARTGTSFPERPSSRDWLHMYRRHKVVWMRASASLTRSVQFVRLMQDYWSDLAIAREIQESPDGFRSRVRRLGRKKLWAEFGRAIKRAKKEYREHIRGLRGELALAAIEVRPDMGSKLLHCPELQFVLSVYLPCLIHYGRSPGWLLREARAGDDRAIEQLVRLDPDLLDDPKLGAWRRAGSVPVRDGRAAMVGRWMQDRMTRSVDAESLKRSFAGLLSAVGEVLAFRFEANWKIRKYKLTAPQIRSLFDAFARDRGVATIAGKDPDLAGISDEAWAKAIDRAKSVWKLDVIKVPKKGSDKEVGK